MEQTDPSDQIARTVHALGASCLTHDDPRAQSGFRGDTARWERLRRPVLAGMPPPQTTREPVSLLDVGCANGHLMECVNRWAAEDGYQLEPFGVDIRLPLVELARRRLPHWQDRIWHADIRSWQPPHRFDAVRTELCYTSADDEPALVSSLLAFVVAPGGRLIVTEHGRSAAPLHPPHPDLADRLRAWVSPWWGPRTASSPTVRGSPGWLGWTPRVP